MTTRKRSIFTLLLALATLAGCSHADKVYTPSEPSGVATSKGGRPYATAPDAPSDEEARAEPRDESGAGESGRASAQPPSSPTRPSESKAAPGGRAAPTTAAPAAAGAATSDAAGRERADRAASRRAEAAPERPGLGTTWGENRTSPVTEVAFVRDDARSPSFVATLWYNDQAGARAMAGREGYAPLDDAALSAGDGAVTVSLRNEEGAPLSGFHAAGRTYAIGEHGNRYTIRLVNHTGARFEAVASVDGLDVLDGKEAAYGKRGYLVAPYGTLDIDGFRRSSQEVAAFRFGSVRDSYAARTGSDRNVGVVGVAFFAERGTSYPWSRREIERRKTADPFPGRYATPPPPR